MSQSAVFSGPRANGTRHGAEGRKVERAIRTLIAGQERLFQRVLLTTDMLCEAAFDCEGPYTKAQRVSVLRVMHRIIATEPGWTISRHQYWLQFSKRLARARKKAQVRLAGQPDERLLGSSPVGLF